MAEVQGTQCMGVTGLNGLVCQKYLDRAKLVEIAEGNFETEDNENYDIAKKSIASECLGGGCPYLASFRLYVQSETRKELVRF
jgi:hypothetical protein